MRGVGGDGGEEGRRGGARKAKAKRVLFAMKMVCGGWIFGSAHGSRRSDARTVGRLSGGGWRELAEGVEGLGLKKCGGLEHSGKTQLLKGLSECSVKTCF